MDSLTINPIVAPPVITSMNKTRYMVYSGQKEDTIQVQKDIWTLTLYNRAGVIKTTTNRTSLDFII